jgi:hypothetical protein
MNESKHNILLALVVGKAPKKAGDEGPMMRVSVLSFLCGEGLVVVDCSSDVVNVHVFIVRWCMLLVERLGFFPLERETGVEIPRECLLLLFKSHISCCSFVAG